MDALIDLAAILPFDINLWTVQNIGYELLHRVLPEYDRLAQQGDAAAQVWVAQFMSLVSKLRLAVF